MEDQATAPRAGEPWLGLTEDQIALVRADVMLRVLQAVNALPAQELVAWTQAIAPQVYVPGGLDLADAQLIEALRPIDHLLMIAAFEVSYAKISDLVYAAAAATAPDPTLVVTEDVFELSVADDARTATARLAIPAVGAHARLAVQSAHITVEGKPQTAELRPDVRQRQLQDTWAEVELRARAKIWYVGVSPQLRAAAVQTGQLLLFPRLGDAFHDRPVLSLSPTTSGGVVPPVSTSPGSHLYYAFPEIEGQRFMLRLGVPPDTATDNDPGPPIPATGWPDKFTFHAEVGDVLLFGPSYPEDVEVRLEPGGVAWDRVGELVDTDESSDVAEAVQSSIDELPPELPAPDAADREVMVVAKTRAPGGLRVHLAADVHAVVEAFADGGRRRELSFTAEHHLAVVPLGIPLAGEPHEAGVGVDIDLTRSVVMAEVGAADTTTGGDRIGVRVAGEATYSQPFTVAEAFALTAVDVRLAQFTDGATVRVSVRADDGSAEATYVVAGGRQARWHTVPVEPALALEPETTYRVDIAAVEGAVTWLCGAGDDIHHLTRRVGGGPPREVTDVTAGESMSGKLRLRTERPVDDPRLEVTVEPGAGSIALTDPVVLEDGRVRARLDLAAALGRRQDPNAPASLRVETRAEGTVTLSRPSIIYRLRAETTE